MAIKFSETVRNARLNAIETAIGTAAVLKLRTGSPPAAIGDPDSGVVVATMTLDSNWMADASGGTKGKSGTWQDPGADTGGTISHFRVYASDGVTQHIQGTVTITGNGGDMTLDNNVVEAGQQITITTFTLQDGNA